MTCTWVLFKILKSSLTTIKDMQLLFILPDVTSNQSQDTPYSSTCQPPASFNVYIPFNVCHAYQKQLTPSLILGNTSFA